MTESRRRTLILAGAVAVAAACRGGGQGPADPAATRITLDPLRRFQTIVGWEATAQAGQSQPGFDAWSGRLFDLAVADLGITRLRLSLASGAESRDPLTERPGSDRDPEWRCRRYRTVNDDDDPRHIEWRGFHFETLDDQVEKVALPIRRRLEARGEKLWLNLEYVAFIAQCAEPFDYVHARPEEYAEFVLAAFLHLRDHYGLVPDGLEIILEPDNVPGWSGERIGRAMVAAAARLREAGFAPELIAPSTTSLRAASRYVDAILDVPGALPLLREISYHRYRGVSRDALEAVAQRAARIGARTAMLEHVGGDVDELYDDLAVGGVSAWQQYTLAFAAADSGAQYYRIVDRTPQLSSKARRLRSYFHYVRPGAVRVAADSDDPAVRALAFVGPGDRQVTVVHLDAARQIVVRGLAPGLYRAGFTDQADLDRALAISRTAADGTLRLRVGSGGLLTISRVAER